MSNQQTVKSIGDIDRNLRVETSLDLPATDWRSAKCGAFQLYGLYQPLSEGVFRRMPEAIAAETNEGVAHLHTNTAGGRIRFRTNSRFVALKVVMPNPCVMPHMAALGSAGFDLYLSDGQTARYRGSFFPPVDIRGGYESVVWFESGDERDILLHMTLYSGVGELYIGLEAGASLLPGGSYRAEKPVVFYGSSITQGGCASRPGCAYTNLISRLLNVDHINLGFSGSARGESVIADYMASLEMSAFVCDYDHNAPSPEHLEKTLWPLYEAIRRSHPEIPFLFVSKPDFCRDPGRRDRNPRLVIQNAYARALAGGDWRVGFIDGETLFDGPFYTECTVDGCHPNDLGFSRMAAVIGRQVARMLDIPFRLDVSSPAPLFQ